MKRIACFVKDLEKRSKKYLIKIPCNLLSEHERDWEWCPISAAKGAKSEEFRIIHGTVNIITCDIRTCDSLPLLCCSIYQAADCWKLDPLSALYCQILQATTQLNPAISNTVNRLYLILCCPRLWYYWQDPLHDNQDKYKACIQRKERKTRM